MQKILHSSESVIGKTRVFYTGDRVYNQRFKRSTHRKTSLFAGNFVCRHRDIERVLKYNYEKARLFKPYFNRQTIYKAYKKGEQIYHEA